MKKYYLIIIAILITVLSFGQTSEPETEPENERESKIRLTPFFSYDFNLSPKTTVNGIFTDYYTYDSFNYRVGVDVEYKFTNKLSLSTGINYSSNDYSFYSDCYVCDPIFGLTAKLRFIEIPLIGIYTYQINEFEIFGQLGIINQVNVDFDAFDDNFHPDKMNRYNFSGKIGIGISYPIFDRHRLIFMTDYTSSITSLFENVDYKLKTFGIRMGIQFLL